MACMPSSSSVTILGGAVTYSAAPVKSDHIDFVYLSIATNDKSSGSLHSGWPPLKSHKTGGPES